MTYDFDYYILNFIIYLLLSFKRTHHPMFYVTMSRYYYENNFVIIIYRMAKAGKSKCPQSFSIPTMYIVQYKFIYFMLVQNALQAHC